MNQILDHSGPKKKRSPNDINDIKKIVKVFSIIILIFGVALIGSGTFSIVNAIKYKNTPVEEEIAEPTILAEKVSDAVVKISVKHQYTIEKVTYNWDDLSATTQKGVADQKSMEISNIGIPTGEHTLKVEVVDINSRKYIEEFPFTCEEGIDSIDPVADVVVQGRKIEIVATDETELQYVTYKIGNDEEKTLYPKDDKKRISEVLDWPYTEATLITVTAVDTSNNVNKYEHSIEMHERPKISFSANSDLSKIIVKITSPSDTPLTGAKVTLNGAVQEVPIPNVTEYEFEVSVTQVGRNDITVEAHTTNEDVYETASGFINYGG